MHEKQEKVSASRVPRRAGLSPSEKEKQLIFAEALMCGDTEASEPPSHTHTTHTQTKMFAAKRKHKWEGGWCEEGKKDS